MKKQLTFLFFFFLLKTSYTQKVAAFQDTIPFRNDLGLLIIPITFNGVEKQFAFDTGAQRSVAYSWAENELKRTKNTITIASSGGLRSKMRFYKSGLIELGSRKIRGHKILNTPKNPFFSCHNIDGILGVDIIKELNWTIDFKRKILIMYPPKHFPESVKEMHALDFNFQKNKPHVFLKLNDTKIKFLLDTGAGGFSNISKQGYNLTKIDEYPQTYLQSGSFDVNGILTTTRPKVVLLPETSSREVLVSPIIQYNNRKSSKIGNHLWKNTQLFLSLKKNQLYSSISKIQEVYTSYSAAVMFSKGKIRIVKIREGSNLWNEGVRQGDEILSFNNQHFTNFCSLDKEQRKIATTGEPYQIELKDGRKFIIQREAILKE
jgi:hypothetical protein